MNGWTFCSHTPQKSTTFGYGIFWPNALEKECYIKSKCMLVCTLLSSHLPSSVTEIWYPCGRVNCRSTVGLSMFSLASTPDVPPLSGTVFLKMWRGAGWGACGGGGARAFILLLGDDKIYKTYKKGIKHIFFITLHCSDSDSLLLLMLKINVNTKSF